MKATIKEQSHINGASKNIVIMFLTALVFGAFIFAKYEYNPYVPTPVIVTRAINSTTYTINPTKQAYVAYDVSVSCTATIGGTASGTISLQYSTNAGSTWITVGTLGNSNTVSLAIALNSVTVQRAQLVGYIPANALVKMVTTTTGSTTATYNNGQETY